MSKIEMYNESSQTLSRFVDFCQTQYTHEKKQHCNRFAIVAYFKSSSALVWSLMPIQGNQTVLCQRG